MPSAWIQNTNLTFQRYNRRLGNLWDAAAAAAAMQVHLPQEQKSRLTFTGSSVDGRMAMGAGLAYRLDDERNSALTFAVGQSSGATAVQASLGFEFGGTRSKPAPMVREIPVIREVVTSDARADELELKLAQAMEYAEQLEERLASIEQAASQAPAPQRIIERHVEQVPILSTRQRQALISVKGERYE